MILSTAQMLEAEGKAFASGVSAEHLMEIAGLAMARFVQQFHPRPGTCRVFAGKGHNGGDVLVAARYLAEWGWALEVVPLFPEDALAPLTAKQRARLPRSTPGAPSRPLVVLDGLLGIGTSGPAREPLATAIRHINALRREEAAWVLCADLPSGLGGDPCVRADATLTMGFAKPQLLTDAATEAVGRLAIAPLPDVEAPAGADDAEVLQATSLRSLLPPRDFDTHKGQCGRVAILAGSLDYPGAARLCSAAAVKAGAGLVTLFVPPEIAPVLAAAVIPEVMVSATTDFSSVLEKNWNAVAIGPGLGRSRDSMICEFVLKCPVPCVVDADALNAVAESPSLLRACAAPRLLTPHPLEMERLFPQNHRTRRDWLEAFLAEYPVTLLLKGSRTLIGERSRPTAYNATGHPGMASGGMGDVLTGVCAALIAQGKSPLQAAQLAAWTCGHAAELALRDRAASQESLSATDILGSLGPAFDDLRDGVL